MAGTAKRSARQRRLPPVETGLKGRCPACGEGNLFAGFLTFTNECEACGADFRDEDAGDGPAVFVILIASIIVIPIALAFGMLSGAPTWLTLVIFSPILIGVCLYLLRILRGVMFNIAWQRSAREVRNQDIGR